jgi:hypothetical protein
VLQVLAQYTLTMAETLVTTSLTTAKPSSNIFSKSSTLATKGTHQVVEVASKTANDSLK